MTSDPGRELKSVSGALDPASEDEQVAAVLRGRQAVETFLNKAEPVRPRLKFEAIVVPPDGLRYFDKTKQS